MLNRPVKKIYFIAMSFCLAAALVLMFPTGDIFGEKIHQPGLEKAGVKPGQDSSPWKEKLDEELPVLGHRNWIVVADSAYPAQMSTGIKTIATGESHFDVLRTVLQAVDEAPHLKPIIYTDEELPYVSDMYSPGVDRFRSDLKAALKDYNANPMPHEEIIAKLDSAGQMFQILILKTNLTIPYSSVFVELDCGYWGEEAAKAFDENVLKAGKKKKD